MVIPLGGEIDYDTARKINEFFGQYFPEISEIFTIERKVNGERNILDYLQMWKGKPSAHMPPGATKTANICTGFVEEVEKEYCLVLILH